MATKSKGVGRGGSRPGAGRKPRVPTAAELALYSDRSVEDLMEIAVRQAAALGRWDEVSKSGARLLNARARQTAAPAARPETPAPTRFAPRPPPRAN